MSFEQAATLLNAINQQVTGRASIAPTDTSGFVSMATTTLQAGYDPVIQAISQIVGKTIFSVRPYSRKFAGLQVDNQKFGAITRKLSIADKDFENDSSFALVDGQSVDPWIVNKPNVLQTNFYGANVFCKSYTIFKDQLDNAFSGPEQFGEFITMVTQNASDMIEQAHESLARATVCNMITGVSASVTAGYRNARDVIHLLSEYNTLTGQNLTATTVYQPNNFKPFMQFVYARVAELTEMMTERTQLYQTVINNKPVMHHAPLNRQKVYLYAPARYRAEMMAIADVYHDNYITMADTESVNFWQSSQTPDTINAKPVYIDSDGAVEEANAAISMSPVFGVVFDDEAAGYTVVNQWTAQTAMNPRAGYASVYHHFTDRYWTDYCEKIAVLVLD
jgi:hypothetical protein